MEAPVIIFARADKYGRQLERHIIPKQPKLRLLYAVATYQISGKFNAAMREWHARLPTNKSFPKFRVYIQHEYTKEVKRNRSTTGSVKKGIAKAVTEEGIIKENAMTISKVASAMQEQNAEQMKTMMTMFKELLTSVKTPTVPTAKAKPKPPRKPREPLTECPNCKKKHANHDTLWELEANKDSRPPYWKSTKSN